MAEAGRVMLHPDLRQWVEDNVKDNFCKALMLTNEGSDPPEEPYCSLYAARELLLGVKAMLVSCPPRLRGLEDYMILSACVQLHLGLNYVNTEEIGTGEEAFMDCLHLLEEVVSKVKTASLSVQAYNQMGLLWGNRNEQQKALEFLLKSKAVHESHISLPPPLTVTEWLRGRTVEEWEREQAFENLHTHTLFYLAQVYGNLGQAKASAQYCQETLSRQLECKEFDAIEWSLNCATLSQYYLNMEHFEQARHCLAAARRVLSHLEGEIHGKIEEKYRQTRADISRCWSKYCIGLLNRSRNKMEEGEGEEGPRLPRLFRFDTLEVTDLESAISCDFVEGYDGAKAVFLFGQKHLDIAKEFYTLNDYCSDHVSILQDHSQLFRLLAYFEPDRVLCCRMHKRRVDMLNAVLEELNPQHYLNICRQLMFELAETLSDMTDHKIILASDSPSTHAIGKINKLIHSAIQFYEKFIATFLDSSGHLPDPLAEEFVRPVLCAKMYSARLHAKIISPEPAMQASNLSEALLLYRWVVEYHERHSRVVEQVFASELPVCQEMVELMPHRIAAIRH